MGDKETLYLVDGSSYIHRAYHAIKDLSSSKGIPTNAILGFTKMILKLLDEKRPRYLSIVFDTKGPTFRHQLYKNYKATRPPMPEDLVEQLPYIKEIVRNFNIMSIEREGYEADDIIGTLAKFGAENGLQVVVVSGDKDFRQIISPQTSMWDPMKDRFIDYRTLKNEYGLEPEQMIDLMGLSGDSSDNIPGVPGIGEKTAMGLIRQYGSIEGVYEHLEEIHKEKMRENLRRSRDEALLSKKLVTIDNNVPLSGTIEDLVVGRPNREELATIFRDLEFRVLWEQFAARKTKGDKDYRLCLNKEDLLSIKEEMIRRKVVSLDTETTSLDPLEAKLVGISFAFEEDRATYLPLGHGYPDAPQQVDLQEAIAILKEVLEDDEIAKVGQNIKYDALVLRSYGVSLRGIHFDTMVASYVINPSLRQHNLDTLAQHYLNHKMISYQDLVGKGKHQMGFSEVDVHRAKDYSCEDADVAFRLMAVLDRQLQSDRNQDLFYNLEMKLIPVLVDMEWIGIRIDTESFQRMSRRFSEQITELEKGIYNEAGMEFNINSPQQLGFVLFEKLGLPVQKKTNKTKAYSTDMKVLEKLSTLPFKLPQLLLRYRTLTKLKSTYLDALVKMVHPSTGRIHTSFNQAVTATGRLSSSNPNLQNIPIRGEEGREIRKGFVADEGHYLVSADYSQVELRIFAHYSRDPAFKQAFDSGDDIHSRTASEILDVGMGSLTPEMRRIAKAINFGIIYGMGPLKLSEELNIDKKTAQNYIDAYYKRYQGVQRYREEMINTAREKGFVTTLFNRRRYLPGIHHDKQRIRAEAERMAVNTPIQGTAADLIKKAMIAIHSRLKAEGFKAKMLLQVHDELVFEVPEEEIGTITPLIKEEMENVYPLAIPLKVDIGIGKNWDEAH
ncbi:MAG: DNA polymerase I [Pseudomonadota bacterium]